MIVNSYKKNFYDEIVWVYQTWKFPNWSDIDHGIEIMLQQNFQFSNNSALLPNTHTKFYTILDFTYEHKYFNASSVENILNPTKHRRFQSGERIFWLVTSWKNNIFFYYNESSLALITWTNILTCMSSIQNIHFFSSERRVWKASRWLQVQLTNFMVGMTMPCSLPLATLTFNSIKCR